MNLLIIIIIIMLFLPMDSQSSDRITDRHFTTRSEVIARNGMAATSQPLATQVAIDILKRGGTAIDAAIAANAVLGLTEPTGCGIGGDLFAIVWDNSSNQLYGLNASGRSPASLSLSYFEEQNLNRIPAYGPLPVSVPGCVDGWYELHRKFGRLEMSEILEPAIDYARKGFPVTEVIAYYWAQNLAARMKYPGFKKTYTLDGKAPQKGDIFKNPDLADTYEKLAQNGRDYFYQGEIARTIDTYMKQNGGFLTLEDLADHQSEWIDPVSTLYRGYEVWELPPNGQGIAALQILNIIEAFDISSFGFGSVEHIHHFVEAKKIAYEDRARFYADPLFYLIPVQVLISKSYAQKRRALLNPKRSARKYEHGQPLEHGDTIYLTVADAQGNMISLIQSNYRGMGSGMTPTGLGFCLQDRGELFTLEKDHFNTYAPRKRPFHTIIPAFITRDGKPWMSFGVMGGSMQPQGHVQIIMNIIDFGMNLQEAGDAPRIRHGGSSQPTGTEMTNGGTVFLESGFQAEVLRELDKMGHRIEIMTGGFGGYQAIMYDEQRGIYMGASESRKDGHAAGY